ncbi:FAD-dependent oxidoreductase [Negadavirga shengliensis]|uniref:FAD-dependent oxidoreductase n=1 Tax=Negadavirga shengliensis TaxID=1389218 RepID=A0ABV9SZC8_9BACT
MIKEGFEPEKRKLREEYIKSDLVIIGGGMAGSCCAITAARAGLKVTLVQDRPVLGGNGSSEIRLWILGATSHMGNNNRWAREGGVIDEILVENLYRNPEGNPLILDTIMVEKVSQEPNIRLLLNTAMYDLEKKDNEQIDAVWAFCSQNATLYKLKAPLYVDASGDGIMAFLAGAAFRIGAESADEFDELFAPNQDYGELLGHSLYFYSKDTGKPVRFVAPAYANKELSKLPRFKTFNLKDHGCRLWWVEYGGRKDTIHESENIKWELWRVIYGIWDHIKNSGEFPETSTHTLEWVGTIPGKRESRRFEGDYMLSQKDVVEQREHSDAVSFGGWALDLHPADGVYGDKPGCTQWHAKGVYQIPYRTMYSKNIKNLFLAGRIISASHVAFGSSRVMATCAHNAQAVAMAAVLCKKHNLLPATIAENQWIGKLQQNLIANGQYIPRIKLDDPAELVARASIQASSRLKLQELPMDGPWKALHFSMAQLMPFPEGELPSFTIRLRTKEKTVLKTALMTSSKAGNFTPDVTLTEKSYVLEKGEQDCTLVFDYRHPETGYLFVCLHVNDHIEVRCSNMRLSGLVTVYNKFNKAVAISSRQDPPKDIGIESFEFWLPERRPEGHNLAFRLDRALDIFGERNLQNGIFRPALHANAWIADFQDIQPSIDINWNILQKIRSLYIYFDTDFDHPMESTLMGHPESEIPFCVRKFKICDGNGTVISDIQDNHQTIHRVTFEQPLETAKIRIVMEQPGQHVPAALFGVVAY